MLKKQNRFILFLSLFWLLCASFSPIYGDNNEKLIVCFATAMTRAMDHYVEGVLSDPDGIEYTTAPLSAYGTDRIILSNPKSGNYKVSFRALTARHR